MFSPTIDVLAIITNSIWLLGLALVLATFSYTDYVLAGPKQSFRASWRQAFLSPWAQLGALLFCAGMAANAVSLPEQIAWLVLLLIFMYCWRFSLWPGAVRRAWLALPVAEIEPQAAAVLPPSRLRHAAAWIVKTELIWLAVLTPFFLFPNPERSLALLGLPLLWLARRVARGVFAPRTSFDWPILGLLLMVLVSIFVTPDLSYSLSKISGVLLGVGVFYALVEWSQNGRRLPLFLIGYLLAGAGLTVVGLLGTNWTSKWFAITQYAAQLPTLLRGLPGAEDGIPVNELAGALLWLIPLQLALLGWTLTKSGDKSRTSWPMRLGLAIVTLLCSGTLVLTQSRGAVTGVALGFALLLWLELPRLRPAFLVLVAIAVAGILFLGLLVGFDRLVAIGLGLDNRSSSVSATGRLDIWARGIQGIKDFPVTGMGMNNFRRVMPILYPLPSSESIEGSGFDVGHAHNQFLQAGLDLGLPGLTAYLSMWLLAIGVSLQTWRREADSLTRSAAAGVACSLLAYLAFGMTDAVALGAKPGIFFWALMALVVVLEQRSRRQQHNGSGPGSGTSFIWGLAHPALKRPG